MNELHCNFSSFPHSLAHICLRNHTAKSEKPYSKMKLKSGLDLTSIADEFNSNFQMSKHGTDPVFMSRETGTAFLLTAHLKGYKRRNIKMDINEDGSLIGISGERQVKEMVMVGSKVYKNDTQTKGFKKIYRIPDGVILDKIKATFNDDESVLTITMPKKVKGVCGTVIEEVKDKAELVREGSGSLDIVDEKSKKAEVEGGEEMPKEDRHQENSASFHDLRDGDEGQLISQSMKKNRHDIQDIKEREHNQEVEPSEEAETGKVHDGEEEKPPERRCKCKMCIPIVAGSTLLLTLVAFVIHIIRSKHQTSRRRE